MTGHVAKKGACYYVVLDLGMQPTRRCSGCHRRTWTSVVGEQACEHCGAELEAPVERRRRQWVSGPDGGWKLKRDAKDELAKILGAKRLPSTTKLTLAEFVEQHWLPALQVRPSTALSYARNMRLHVLPHLGAVKLRDLKGSDLSRLYRALLEGGHRGHRKGAGLSPRTVRYLHTIVHKALGAALRDELVDRNAADAAEPPRAQDAAEAAPEMTTWSAPQVDAFLGWVRDDRYGPAFHFLATTGMRRGEALGLRWADVDLEAGKVSIRRTLIVVGHQVTYGYTKTGKGRVIELDAGTVAVLRQQRARQGQDRWLFRSGYQDGDLVFSHPDGRPFHPERFSREFDRKVARYNREHPEAPLPRLRLHDLRHTWATLALRAGVHPKVVAERLGHANTTVTLNVYSHVVEGMQADAAETVAALIFGASGTPR